MLTGLMQFFCSSSSMPASSSKVLLLSYCMVPSSLSLSLSLSLSEDVVDDDDDDDDVDVPAVGGSVIPCGRFVISMTDSLSLSLKSSLISLTML